MWSGVSRSCGVSDPWLLFVQSLLTALSLAALGAIDSLLTSIVADNMTKTKHKPNQELVGQGIGNSIAAIFGGIPGAGATIRTVVNIQSGGKTKLSGMFAGVLLLVVLLSLGPLASRIPAAVLAGILITVGIGVLDYKGLRHIRLAPCSFALQPWMGSGPSPPLPRQVPSRRQMQRPKYSKLQPGCP